MRNRAEEKQRAEVILSFCLLQFSTFSFFASHLLPPAIVALQRRQATLNATLKNCARPAQRLYYAAIITMQSPEIWGQQHASNTLVCRTLVFKVLLSLFMQLSKLDQILGLEIQRRRVEQGWSQEYLAEVTGLHRTYISQLERGLKSPSVRVLNHITNALGITMSEFLQVVEELLSADGKRD